MRWIGDRESENIEDRRGGGMPMAVGGIGGLGAIIVLVVGLFLGIDPNTLMSVLNGGDPSMPQQQTDTSTGNTGSYGSGSYGGTQGYGSSRPPETRPEDRAASSQGDTTRHFVAVVL